jgi:riboflavin kinase/FMN adenylyltransferase
MLLLRHLQRVGRRFSNPVLTLGNFDGVHLGHQEILRRVVEVARQRAGDAIVLTFYPHPIAVLAPERAPRLLTDRRTRIERIAASGVDAIVMERFTREFSLVGAEEFVRRYLVDELGVRAVVVGHRVSFGRGRQGDADTLRRLGAECGFDVEVVGPIEVDGVSVSSSAVRDAIVAGELSRAAKLLGRPPGVAGRVVSGMKRGKSLGFPTANLRVGHAVLPPDGVYAVRARISAAAGQQRCGVANLGFNPTFGDTQRGLEVHLFDFDGDLYGRRLEVDFVHRLRGEVRFPNAHALAEQIARDVAEARHVLGLPVRQ